MSTDIAPNKYLPCPRCGLTTFTRHEVKVHDDWHKAQDDRDKAQDEREKRLGKVMDHLEAFLAAVEFEPDPETGETQTFTGWMTDTDDILETLTEAVEQLKNAAPFPPAHFVLEAGEWPTDVSSDADAPAEPTEDEDAGLAAVLTTPPTEAPDDDLEDPTSDPDEPAVATVFGAPVTYGQTGVIA